MRHLGYVRPTGPVSPQTGLQLHHAAGVRRGDDAGLRAGHIPHLLLQKPPRHLGLGQVVDTAATAAAVGVSHLDELEAGDSLQDGARLDAGALGVGEVARVLIGHAPIHASHLRVEGQGDQELTDVLDEGGERGGLLGVVRVVFEELAILLQRRAAAGGVGQNSLHIQGEEDVDVAAGEATGRLKVAGVDRESAAAGLLRRDEHLAAIAGQDAHRGLVEIGVEDRRDTPREQGDPMGRAGAPGRLGNRRQREDALRQRWEELLHVV